jgi:chromosome segregation protein
LEWQTLQERKVFLETRNRELKTRMETAKQAEIVSRKQMDTLNIQLEAIRKKILNLSASQARTLQASQSAVDNRRQAERKLKRLEEEILVAAREQKAQERALREIVAEIEEISGSVCELEQTLTQKRNQLDVQLASFREMTEHVRMLSDQRHGIELRLSSLRKLTDTYEGFQDGVKALMKHWSRPEGAADHRIPRIFEVVANILEPEPGYEAALEAGLNEILQGIVIDSADTARGAIEYLRANKAGRCGFLVPVPDASRNFPTVHPLAAGASLIDHVRITADVPMLSERLSRIIVVETLDEALSHRNALMSGQTIVTRDGMRVDMEGGLIVGGSQSDAGGILFRKTEIKRLEAELSACLMQLEDGRQASKAREMQVKELEVTISRIIQDIRNEKDDLLDAEKRRIQIEESGKHLRRNIDILHIERERLSGEETDSESEISRLQDVLAQIERELQTEQDRLDGCQKSIGECAGKRDVLQNERQALQVDWTASGAQLENTIDTLRRLAQFRTESDQRIGQLNERIADIRKQHASCAAKIAANTANIEAWTSDFGRLGETLKSAEADLQSLELQRSAMEETIRAVQENRDSATQQVQALEIELARHREKRDRAKNDMTTLSAAPLSELRRQLSEVLDDPAFDPQAASDALQRKKAQLQQFGDINTAAIRELEEIRERHTFLQTQKDDLIKAMNDIQSVIRKIDRLTQETFLQTFEAVNGKLQEVFPQLFDGGSAGLVMTEPNNPLETGVEFMIQPPGKRLTRISLLSGGEKALCAIAFIFSIFLIRPASFCLLDEIDAPLDEANVQRFNRLLGIVGEKAQILMATHNRRTMAFADMLIGVTTENKGISRIVPVKWEEINHFVKEEA